MKKLYLVLLFLVSSTTFIYSQEKVSEYYMSAFVQYFEVLASDPEKEELQFVYIQAKSGDKLIKQTYLFVHPDTLITFSCHLNYLKSLFVKWSDIAKNNKVNDFEKEVTEGSIKVNAAFYDNKWCFDRDVNLIATFKVINGMCYMVLSSGKLTSFSDENYTCDGFVIALASVGEFDMLIKSINKKTINDYYKQAKSKDELFK